MDCSSLDVMDMNVINFASMEKQIICPALIIIAFYRI